MKYFIIAEDLARALVGPFDTKADAETHVTFCVDRGDGATHEIVSQAELDTDADNYDLVMTAEEDRAFNVDDCIKRMERRS